MTIDDPALRDFEQRCRDVLAGQCHAVDAATHTRLSRARRLALEAAPAAEGVRPFRIPGVWLPAGVLSFAMLLALAVWVSRPAPLSTPTADATPVEDVELLASGEEPDLYAEDAAFYEWAGQQAGTTG